MVVVVSSQRSVEHRRRRSVSSLPPQLFPLTPVEPSQELHHRKQQAPDAAPRKASLATDFSMPWLKPSTSATKFRNENTLFEWLRECCGCGPPTMVVEAGTLLGPGIVCMDDEGMMGLQIKMIAYGLIKK